MPDGHTLKYGKNLLEFQYEDQPKRQHILYLPKSYDGFTLLPTVLGLHYSSGNIDSIDAMANLSDLAERHNFVWIAPQGGVTFKNNQGYAWNIPFVPTTDDSNIEGAVLEDRKYLVALLQHVQNDLCVNTAQSYAMGHSGGGRMSSSLVCNPEMSQHFAGIVASSSLRAGPSAGPDYAAPLAIGQPNACNPSHPIGVVALHGLADETNPYDGTPEDGTEDNKKRWGYSVQSALTHWAELDSCDLSSNTTVEATIATDGPIIHQQTINCPNVDITAWLQDDWPHAYFDINRADFNPGDHWWDAISKFSHEPQY
ncbi:polyhydroxybutyrate depolymerase [Ceraceosorus bombacis]|uniref:feruloyl esterase n=1 Tax=Ceraceosorus bombacis TaxID=401625 RepID=A0A0P1BQ90_9BASI|nr:polyhydroxybutyrate depolymerase [Ceraceosorus bombacis]